MRYLILILLNIPAILLAFVGIITQYKLKPASKRHFQHQLILWVTLSVVLVGSYPAYNYIAGRAPLDSSDLSIFDIVQTTAIVALIYAANTQRQRAESNERRLNDLHQELSIMLSEKKDTHEK